MSFFDYTSYFEKKSLTALKVLNEKNMLKLFQLKQEKRSKNFYLTFFFKLFAGYKFPPVLIYTHTHIHTHTHTHKYTLTTTPAATD